MLVAGAAIGGMEQCLPLAAQTPVSMVATKPNGPVQPPRPVRPAATPQPLGAGAGSEVTAQTKIVMTYRGAGRFDAGLALQLQPILAKRFGQPAPAPGSKTPADWLKSILGQGDASGGPSQPRAAERTGPP